ncbi:MAG: aminoacyl-tRNA hydrolase [Eubacteriales bacterium]
MGRGTSSGLKSDFYIFGLGNPEARFARTRHNAGFDVLDILAEENGVRFSLSGYHGLCAKIESESGNRVLLVKPQTYMNNSGRCVSAFIKKFNVPLERILVIYDDLDLNLAAIRIRKSGSAGTHNGLRSVVYHLKTDAFPRIRVGIGRPEPGTDIIPFVLGRYTPDEQPKIFEAYQQAGKAAMAWVENGLEAAMQKYNTKGR